MFAVEVVVAYGSLPDPAEVVIPRFAQRLLLKLKLSKILSMISIEVVVAFGSLPDTAEMVIPTKIFSMIAVEIKITQCSLTVPVEVVTTPGSFITF